MPSKSDQAYDFLRQSIMTCEITPGTPLRIQTLGKETGFGSTPVREALCRLEAEHFVVSEMNRGFRAAPISVKDMIDLESSRCVIETALFREAIKNGDDAWEARIVAAHYRLAKLTLPTDTSDASARLNWSLVHQEFHDSLLGAANSKWLRSFHEQISEQLARFYHYTIDGPLRQSFETDEEMKALLRNILGLEHHTALMQAALERNEDRAITLLTEHIHFASQYFERMFEKE